MGDFDVAEGVSGSGFAVIQYPMAVPSPSNPIKVGMSGLWFWDINDRSPTWGRVGETQSGMVVEFEGDKTQHRFSCFNKVCLMVEDENTETCGAEDENTTCDHPWHDDFWKVGRCPKCAKGVEPHPVEVKSPSIPTESLRAKLSIEVEGKVSISIVWEPDSSD